MNIVTAVLLSVAILIAILLMGVRIFGVTPYTVLSGSMEPRYPIGSVVYVKEVDVATLQEGDVITYCVDGKTVVTHRIIEIFPDDNSAKAFYFRTQGDNNNTPDTERVHSDDVMGKAVFCLPLLGYVSYFIQTPPWTYVLVFASFALILLSFLPDLLEKAFSKEENENEKVTP